MVIPDRLSAGIVAAVDCFVWELITLAEGAEAGAAEDADIADVNWVEHELARVSIPENARPVDLDGDGDLDFVSTRGNSYPYHGVFWLEQVRTPEPARRFVPARESESREVGLPTAGKYAKSGKDSVPILKPSR